MILWARAILAVGLVLLFGAVSSVQALPEREVLRLKRFAAQQLIRYLNGEPTDPHFGVFFEATGNAVVSITLFYKGAEYVWTYTRFPTLGPGDRIGPIEWMTLTITVRRPGAGGRLYIQETHFIDDQPFGIPDEVTDTRSVWSPDGLEEAQVDLSDMEEAGARQLAQSRYDEALAVFLNYVKLLPLGRVHPSSRGIPGDGGN